MQLPFLLFPALAVLSSSLCDAKPSHSKRPRSVIQIISDGYGPASVTFARSYMQAKDQKSWDTELELDKYHIGSIRTRSTDSLVTDSAASATAYSCGVKSVNAYIGVDIDQQPCGTVLEGAKAKGYNTALVSTSRITHATPASYSAHINDRDLENEIAVHQLGGTPLGRTVDILWGGGRRHFLPNSSSDSVREDDRDLVGEARTSGWDVLFNRTQFDAIQKGQKLSLPSLGLFAKSHMAYELDRDDKEEPSLTEMTIKALDALKREGKPFFMMTEAARIDHAAHNNDGLAHLHDILEYQRMFDAVTKWVEENDEGTGKEPEFVVISTSDHECGGLTLGEQREEDEEGGYFWYPDVYFEGKRSTEFLSANFLKITANKTEEERRMYMADYIVKDQMAIKDAQDDEIERALYLSKEEDSGLSLTIWLASMHSWRAHVGWSTTGHSGVDVPLYVYTKEANQKIRTAFTGNHENTWIGQWTSHYLGLDLDGVSAKLNNGSNVQIGAGSANQSTPTARYHGGLKRVVPPVPASGRKRSIGYSHADNIMLYGARGMRVDSSDRSHRSVKRHSEL